jgi:hypothetical protein
MEIRIDDPAAVPALRRYLSRRTNFVVHEVEPGALAVGVVGSFLDGGHVEVEHYLRPWCDRHRSVAVSVVPDL